MAVIATIFTLFKARSNGGDVRPPSQKGSVGATPILCFVSVDSETMTVHCALIAIPVLNVGRNAMSNKTVWGAPNLPIDVNPILKPSNPGTADRKGLDFGRNPYC